jgi:UDP:flavonoid glycosyltransferase YjiC (YdhE family)
MQKAALCITHAGLNTVLDALGNGVPLVAIPISFDQPGTGSRITYHRLGESVSLSNISVKDHLKNIIHQVLGDETYANNARAFAKKLQALDGLNTAVNMIVQVLHSNTPIYNNQPHHSIL